MRLLPVFGLPILMILLIILFSLLLPDTFPTMLNLRSIIAEKAIIASRFPAVEELVQDGVTALLPPPEDVESWHGALAALLADPARTAALAARGRCAYEARLTWAARAETIRALL